jgi:phosphoribosyl-AMP cyclohydrolase
MTKPERQNAGIEGSARFTPRFDANGLIPCIAVDAASGDVLMMAWMNAEALGKTLESGYAHYWSRSRNALWKKGETSGAVQRVVEVRTDCDQDTLLLIAEVADRRNTCHTGRPSCFYRNVPLGAGPLERDFLEAE